MSWADENYQEPSEWAKRSTFKKQPTIKFSYHYKKMPPVLSDPTYITKVYKTHYRDLTPEFIEQDTVTDEGEHYPLPKTDLIVIELFTDGHKWQTIRRFTPQKFDYYKSIEGHEVLIKIVPMEKKHD